MGRKHSKDFASILNYTKLLTKENYWEGVGILLVYAEVDTTAVFL
jgi:hypothetical protein